MNIYEQLRNKLNEAVERNRADGILLSGGLDTSILAFLAKPAIAFTVALKGSQAPDLHYSEKVCKLLSMEHKKREFSVEEALNALPEVIKILKTFDLALPNDLSIYFALELAKENDADSVMTGDGSDELFAGYSYMTSLPPEDLRKYISRLSRSWHFSASDLGDALGIEIKQPFLDKDFVHFALDISPGLKVKESIGKYVLRRSFEDLIPREIVWREKDAIEYGSGSNQLRKVISNIVSKEELQSAIRETGIRFMNKEHLFYYRVYREAVGEIPKAKSGDDRCPSCGASIGKSHCRVCGFSYPL